MNDVPLISIIVPAYNAEAYIEGCINSVIEQSYSNWEMIIIDDGSNDDTYKKALQFASINDSIHVIHTDNNGVCSARNHGIEASKGEYITFLDVDDELASDALKKLLSISLENNSDITIGQCTRIKPNGDIVKSVYPKEFELWKGQEAIIHSLEDHPATYSVWGKLYKKSVIGDTRFEIGRKVHEDSFFLFELLIKNPIVAVKNDYIYRYNITSNSASRTEFSDKFLDIKHFVERKRSIIQNEFPNLMGYIPNLLIKADMALLHNLCKTKEYKYSKIENQCLKEVFRYKKFFKPAIKSDEKWFWIITHHMYKLYKIAYLIKNAIIQR